LSDRDLRLIADRDERALKRNKADEKTDLLEGLALELWLRLCELPGLADQRGPRWAACVEFFTGHKFLWTRGVEQRLERLDEQYAALCLFVMLCFFGSFFPFRESCIPAVVCVRVVVAHNVKRFHSYLFLF
jgi:hypothetical protein